MNIDTAKMIDDKRLFIAKIQELLQMDSRSGVKEITYKVDFRDECIVAERIEVEFLNGHKEKICTTANSHAANLKAVEKIVYGVIY